MQELLFMTTIATTLHVAVDAHLDCIKGVSSIDLFGVGCSFTCTAGSRGEQVYCCKTMQDHVMACKENSRFVIVTASTATGVLLLVVAGIAVMCVCNRRRSRRERFRAEVEKYFERYEDVDIDVSKVTLDDVETKR